MINNFFRSAVIIFIYSAFLTLTVFSDSTSDKTKIKSILITDPDYEPSDNIKKPAAVFNAGGSINTDKRILFKTFKFTADSIEPVPNDMWFGELDAKIWTRLSFEEDRFIHLGVIGLFKMDRFYDKYKRISLVPMFNIDEFYFNWGYPIGKVIIGRTNYNLKSTLVFNGPLDAVEVNINIPYFNFKSFLGFTGLLGIFHPLFNPYSVSSIDRSYVEETNLLHSQMIIKLNAEQARRMFFATDFDVHFFGHHVNPYFLMQYDFTSLFYNLNNEFDVHTFHLGLNLEGRIISSLYYKVHLSGLLGMSPSSDIAVTTPITSCALETLLRYTIKKAANSTFILSYALGMGNNITKDEWTSYSDDYDKGFWADKYDGAANNKFIYYGKFDGGYVLSPILSNIHSFSFKYIATPVNKGSFRMSLYVSGYQTLKLWSRAPISDDEADLDAFLVGTEIDTGLLFDFNSQTSLAFDAGIFIPETAYSDKSLRFKMGMSLGVSF